MTEKASVNEKHHLNKQTKKHHVSSQTKKTKSILRMCLKQGLQKRRVSKQNKQSGARGPGLDSVAWPSAPLPVPGDFSRRRGAPAHPKKNILAPASP